MDTLSVILEAVQKNQELVKETIFAAIIMCCFVVVFYFTLVALIVNKK